MAGSGLLALLDDITTLLDDIASMTKVAAVKTAGVTGDDMAVTAHQMGGIAAKRELPVVWAVAKGSFKNKLILIPAVMAVSAVSIITGLNLIAPLLIIGGAYLCYEGFEKILHKKEAKDENTHQQMLDAAAKGTLEDFEKNKIKGAIRTDFILSAEIMVIALGTAASAPFLNQLGMMSLTGIGMTVFVYSLVAAIVKLDDAGLALTKKKGDSKFSNACRKTGQGILDFAPWLMKGLGVLGTAAMFMVGGNILMDYLPGLSSIAHGLNSWIAPVVYLAAGAAAGVITVLGHKALEKMPGYHSAIEFVHDLGNRVKGLVTRKPKAPEPVAAAPAVVNPR